MRRAVRRDHTVIGTVALALVLLLVAINIKWPNALAMAVAIGGVVGALVVLYEVRLTKRIAQAEFIRDLQTSFTSDTNIAALWRKLLMNEPIEPADRPLVSNYLTFFETLQLLIHRGALEIGLIDDLFRNRFFTAIGDKGIQRIALIRQAGAFANIHALIAEWHDHLVANGTVIHPGYYSYVEAITEAKGYDVVPLGASDLDDLMMLQQRVLATLPKAAWLRANSREMLDECLTKHTCIGARRAGELVAAAVLYDGGESRESIRRYFTDDPAELARSINLKVVLTLPEHRRSGIARALIELLEQRATELGKTEITCTIHPSNTASRALFRRLGYRRAGTVSTSYGKRRVYVRSLPSTDKHWAR